MRKKREKIIEDMTFQSVGEAKEFYVASVQRENKRKIALVLAGLGTAGTLVSMITGNSSANLFTTICLFLELCAPLLGIIAYVLAGGFKDAFKMALKVGKFGYIICPIILVDLVVGFVTILVSLMAFLYAPFLFVYLSVKQTKKMEEEAYAYLQAHGAADGLSELVQQTENVARVISISKPVVKEQSKATPKTEVEELPKIKPQIREEKFQFCGYCGAKLKTKTKFCIVCGESTED